MSIAIGLDMFVGSKPSPPTVTGISPNAGGIAGGDAVTITGTSFLPGSTVTIGGLSATSVVRVDDHTITCVTPAHAIGSTDVVVTTSAGSGTLTNGFLYLTLHDALYDFGNLVGRWRADKLVTGTSTITAWGDLSGVGDTNRNAVASGTDRPSLDTSDANLNNQPAIFFDATQVLKTATWSIAQVQPLTIAVFGYKPVGAGTNDAFDGGTNLSIFFLSGAGFGGFMNSGTGAAIVAGPNITAASLVLCEFNGAVNSKLFINSSAPVGTGDAGTAGFTAFTLGNRVLNSSDGNWKIAEIAVWSKVLSAQNKTDIAAYALARYGITVA
jgi:hypothetical protein